MGGTEVAVAVPPEHPVPVASTGSVSRLPDLAVGAGSD